MVSAQEIIACIKHIGSEKEQQVIDVLKRFEGEVQVLSKLSGKTRGG